MLDSAVLFLLGAVLIFAPHNVLAAFQFKDLPRAVDYLVTLWGCVFITIAWGYAVAATNPLRHIVWVQVGIARGTLEWVLGLVYWQTGVVTFAQAGFGIVVAAIITVAYLVAYPRKAQLAQSLQTRSVTAQKS